MTLSALRLACYSLLLLIASLPLMKISTFAVGYQVTLTDGLFLVTAALWTVALVRRETDFRWHPFFLLLALYLAAMALSVFASTTPHESLIKLATQVYLLALPVLAYQLIDTSENLRRLLTAWLAGSAITVLIGIAAIIAFYSGASDLAKGSLHEFGLLPPGHYPRVEATFFFPAMLCNYLSACVFILAAARERHWLGSTISAVLLAAIVVTALFTETAGLGGFALALAACIYLLRGGRSRALAISGAAAAALVSVAISSVTPIIHPTAPYLIELPTGQIVAPAVRLLTWTDAWRVFIAHPLIGAGLDAPGIAVRFIDPSGLLHVLTDAHNAYLNMAAECGLIGLGALLLIVYYVMRRTQLSPARPIALSLLLGLAWLDCFAVQGLVGSFEDARHLWVLVGLWLASLRLEASSPSPASSPARE